MEKSNLLLIDISSIAHQQYHAPSEPILTKTGIDKRFFNAVVAVVNMIISRGIEPIKDHSGFKPDMVALCFDWPGEYFKQKTNPDYKANRPEKSEDFLETMADLLKYFKGMGYPTFISQGFEADDLIGTIVNKVSNNKSINIAIATRDKDLAQLVSDNVCILDRTGNKYIAENNFEEFFGVPRKHFLDYLALAGDTSDNLKVVDGCSEGTASKIVSRFGGIEDVFSAAENKKQLEEKLKSTKIAIKEASKDEKPSLREMKGEIDNELETYKGIRVAQKVWDQLADPRCQESVRLNQRDMKLYEVFTVYDKFKIDKEKKKYVYEYYTGNLSPSRFMMSGDLNRTGSLNREKLVGEAKDISVKYECTYRAPELAGSLTDEGSKARRFHPVQH